jgi:nitrite reductase/ring-hydroxylating ferredoxin subunit
VIRVRVCRVEDVPPGHSRGFAVPGLTVPVMITNVDGTLYASSSECPHEVVSLLGGSLAGRILTCPGHGYQFDLATGRCAHDPDLHLPCYRVAVTGGEVWVEIL